MSDNPPPQFSLRTLLIAVAAVAVVCSLVALCGYTGPAGLAMIVAILAGGAGAFVGLLVCSYSGLGFGFEDIRWDALKCLVLATITVLVGSGLYAWSPVGQLQAITLIVAIIAMKLFWDDFTIVEMGIVTIASISMAGIVTTFLVHWAAMLLGT